MKYIIHFLFICYSYSYIMDLPFPSFEQEYLKKNINIHTDNDKNPAKYNSIPKQIYKMTSRQPKIRNHMKDVAKNLKNLKRYIERRQADKPNAEMRMKKKSEEVLLDSSTGEKEDYQKEFKDGRWLHKQFEALNKSIPKGDGVNMLAVRPWGVPCGDPGMTDMATGTCTLAAECDPELRIFRGDNFCKRGEFVCCAILENAYDLNQPFDISFAGSSFDTDSEEVRNRNKKKDIDKKKNEQAKRTIERQKRKSEMKKLIERIVREVRGIMNKAYRNGTKSKMKKTKQLKKFLLDLKNQYKKDRQSVKDMHEVNQITIDATLRKKLHELKEIYSRFMNNDTFRNIVLNDAHSMSKREASMLMEAYPELEPYFAKRRDAKGKDLDMAYDVEYGLMYF